MTNTENKKCVIYTRKSHDDTKESLDNQWNTCVDYIRSSDNWELAQKHYSDDNLSEEILDRPGLNELIHDVINNLIDVVVVHSIDRLSYLMSDFIELIELFNEHNVSLVSVTQNFDTSTTIGKQILSILQPFVQFELKMALKCIEKEIHIQKICRRLSLK